MRADLILPLLLLFGTQSPSGDPSKPAAPMQEAAVEPRASLNMDDLRALLAAKRFEQAAEGARGYLAANPEGKDAVTARVILCFARLEGSLPPPNFENPFEPGSSKPLKAGGEVRRPEKIYGQPPQYTANARSEKVNGVVIYETTVDHEGCVRDMRLVQGLHPELDAIAKWSFERWVFRPAMLKGHPVSVSYNLTANFQIE